MLSFRIKKNYFGIILKTPTSSVALYSGAPVAQWFKCWPTGIGLRGFDYSNKGASVCSFDDYIVFMN